MHLSGTAAGRSQSSRVTSMGSWAALYLVTWKMLMSAWVFTDPYTFPIEYCRVGQLEVLVSCIG